MRSARKKTRAAIPEQGAGGATDIGVHEIGCLSCGGCQAGPKVRDSESGH